MVSHTQAVVLAAGRSSRFNTSKSKLLHSLCGKPMIHYPLSVLEKLSIPATVVLSPIGDSIKNSVQSIPLTTHPTFAIQHEQKGTADAVAASVQFWDAERVLIMNGDTPTVTPEVIEDLVKAHEQNNATISFVTSNVFDPTGYGRVISENGICIIEEKECTPEQKKVNTVNAGIYLVQTDFLRVALEHINASSTTGEYYLTDLVALASAENKTVATSSADYDSVRGINTLIELWQVEQIIRCKLLQRHKLNGVRFMLPQSVHIEHTVTIGPDTVVGTGAYLTGNTKIGKNVTIEPYVVLHNATIDDGAHIYSHTSISDSVIEARVQVGPFARLRNEAQLEQDSLVGNFVEVKKSVVGKNSKAKHLAYLGDATLGSNVNIGAGTITCNHDGAQKHTTIINDGAYVGSNTTLVAPVEIGEQAFTAAGSVITQSVEKDGLAIARSKQVTKQGYAKRIREKKLRDKNKKKKGVKPAKVHLKKKNLTTS